MNDDPCRVGLGRGGLLLGETERLMLSGEVHPWRIDPARWAAVLDQVVELGFTNVSTYVPWCVHETAPGHFDFSGERDIVGFLELVADRDLTAMVRIGPDSGAEQETSGWPRRVMDDPECQARRPNGLPYLLATATGHGFPPSYASARFRSEVARWYDAVVPLLAPLQWPDGPVAACQVDNELGFHFQANSFALDYHADALTAWRSWLAERWHDIDLLNDAYGTRVMSFADVEPPRDGTDPSEIRRIDWVTWREHHRREVLSTFAGWARDGGMDRVPIVHNDYPRTDTPMELGTLEAEGVVDWAAADIYATRPGGRFVRDLARRLAGSSQLPFMAELGAGWLTLPWLLPLSTSAADEEVIALRTFFSGAKAANVYMLVERDRWYGSPITVHGEPRAGQAELWPRLRALLDRIDWTDLRRHVPVLLLDNRAERRRVAARDTLGGVVPCFSQLLPLDARLAQLPHPETDELARWENGFAAAIDQVGIDCDRATTASVPDLSRYEVVVVPALDVIEADAWAALSKAAAGGCTVVTGPKLPVLDERLRPQRFDETGITLMPSPDELVPLLPDPPITRDRPEVDMHLWSDGTRQILAAFNSSGEGLTSTLAFTRHIGSTVRLEGLWGPETLEGDGKITVDLPPWGAQIWEVHR